MKTNSINAHIRELNTDNCEPVTDPDTMPVPPDNDRAFLKLLISLVLFIAVIFFAGFFTGGCSERQRANTADKFNNSITQNLW